MVMPLFDDTPTKRSMFPFVTYGLIAANVFVLFMTTPHDTVAINGLFLTYGLTPASISGQQAALSSFPTWLTPATYQFLHGDVIHLLSNMIFLWVFGDDIEDSMGPVRFLAFYLLCGVAGGLCQVAVDSSSMIPLVGASGSVSGVIAGYFLVRPCAKVGIFYMFMVVRVQAYWVAGLYIVTQIFHAASGTDDGVGYWAHLGGLAAGAVLFPIMRYRHVPLFECVESAIRSRSPTMPDTSELPGSPHQRRTRE